METTKSEDLYLRTIYDLSLKMEYVKSADIARTLDYSRASVLCLLRKLEEKGLVEFGDKKRVLLTKEGYSLASTLSNRHKVLVDAFENIGASHELAEKEAHQIESSISNEMLNVIYR